MLTFLILALASCSNPDRLGDREEEPADTAVEPLRLSRIEGEGRLMLRKEVEQELALEKMQSKVSAAMTRYLYDPHSAQYSHIRAGQGGSICGKVNGKNRYGAYVGFKDFVLRNDGETLNVSDYNDGVRTAVYGSFAEAYLDACASAEERQEHSRATAPMAVENLALEDLIVDDTERTESLDPFAE